MDPSEAPRKAGPWEAKSMCRTKRWTDGAGRVVGRHVRAKGVSTVSPFRGVCRDDSVLGVPHRVRGVLHRVVGTLHRVLGTLHRVLGLLHRVLGIPHRRPSQTRWGPLRANGGTGHQEEPQTDQ